MLYRIAFAALLCVFLGACPSYDVLVVRYAARDTQCPQHTVRIEEHLGPGQWLIRTCMGVYEYWGDNGDFRRADDGMRYGGGGSRGGRGDVHVRGYRRRDGTYVHPHTRHRPR
jgi:hypothetical protein